MPTPDAVKMMEIVNIFENPFKKEPCALALGIFDGVHIGHKALLSQTAQQAQKSGLLAAVFTISDGAAYKKTAPLFADKEKYAKMESCGIARVYTARFEQIRDLSPETFIAEVLIKRLGCEVALCGENFRFGKGAAGSADILCKEMQANGFRANVCQSVLFEGKTVSASAIKEALACGQAELAAAMLGEPFTLRSAVLHGKGIGGAKLGVPTVNLAFEASAFVPKHGVYASRTQVGDAVYPSLTNVGLRPTFETEAKANAETHILAEVGNLYGKEVAVSLLSFLRPERRFENEDALKAQLQKDCEAAKSYLNQRKI